MQLQIPSIRPLRDVQLPGYQGVNVGVFGGDQAGALNGGVRMGMELLKPLADAIQDAVIKSSPEYKKKKELDDKRQEYELSQMKLQNDLLSQETGINQDSYDYEKSTRQSRDEASKQQNNLTSEERKATTQGKNLDNQDKQITINYKKALEGADATIPQQNPENDWKDARFTAFTPNEKDGFGNVTAYPNSKGQRVAIEGETAAMSELPPGTVIEIKKPDGSIVQRRVNDTGSAVKARTASNGKLPIVDIYTEGNAEELDKLYEGSKYRVVSTPFSQNQESGTTQFGTPVKKGISLENAPVSMPVAEVPAKGVVADNSESPKQTENPLSNAPAGQISQNQKEIKELSYKNREIGKSINTYNRAGLHPPFNLTEDYKQNAERIKSLQKKDDDSHPVTLSSADEYTARLISQGKLAVGRASGIDPKKTEALLERAGQIAQAERREFDPSQTKTKLETYSEFKSLKPGTAGNGIRHFNAALDHLQDFKDATTELKNSGIPLWNRIKNRTLENAGTPQTQAVMQAVSALSAELGQAYKGGVPAEGEIQQWIKNLNQSKSPAQFDMAIKTLGKLLGGVMKSYHGAYEAGTNGEKPDFQFIYPEGRQAIKNFGLDPDQMDPPLGKTQKGQSQQNQQDPKDDHPDNLPIGQKVTQNKKTYIKTKDGWQEAN